MNRGQVKKIKITERGWAGHFCGALECRFRRNTLIEFGNQRIVVSTVGLWKPFPKIDEEFTQLRDGCYFETVAFWSDPNDKRYRDADIRREIKFSSPWKICKIDADDKANEMHDVVVQELAIKLQKGELNG